MGFFLTDALQSALTPAGTNARQDQQSQQGTVANGASTALQGLWPTLQSQAQFAGALEPARQAAVRNLLALSSPGNAAARQRLFQNQAYAQAAEAAGLANQANLAAGRSDAFGAGQDGAIANQAAAQTNDYANLINSPDYHLQQAQSLLGQVSNAMQLPSLGTAGQLAGLVYGRPAVTVEPGLGHLVGTLAGDYLGALGGE